MGQSTKAGPLKCPRCESTNTKFCYYNNYNKTQPRHFCKGCKRHWTEGGILRNVPIGGGRKNKRLKTSSTTTMMITGEKTSSSSNSQIVVQSKQNYQNFDPLVTSSTIVHRHHHTQCNPAQWGLEKVESTQTLLPPRRDRETVSKRPPATSNTIVEEKILCDDIFFEELNFTSPSLPSKANFMAKSTNVFTSDHDVPHQDENKLVVSFSSGNPSSIPTSFQSSNVSSYMEESIVTTAVAPMTCVSQPWQGPAGTNNCVMDNNMSGYWNWNDIDALVSADDLNIIIPWDDHDRKLKP